ncbi:MAG: nucleotide exchange factor GrpE [Acidimicrobiales bacterium]
MTTEQGAAYGGPGAAGRDRPPTGDEIPSELLVDDGPEDVGEGAAPPDAGVPPSGGTEVLADAASLVAERDEYLLALQRLQADFENYRKRVVRQQEEQSARAALDLVGKVLPVLDTLDLARAHLGGESGGDMSEEGRALDQARSQLLDVLSKEGLERVDAAGVEFDPVVHDAVAHAPAEPGPAGGAATDDVGDAAPSPGGVTVDEVLRAGYRWRGQVLRPAMVRVRG